MFFVDLDEFKTVNDRYGHRVGDELLMAVAKRLTGVLRPGDSLARLSGDEFVILCEDLDDPSQADPIAARIGEEMTRPFALSPTEIRISASVGIAFTGRGNHAPEDLLDSADLAMYRTKRRKHGTHVVDLRDVHLAEHQVLEQAWTDQHSWRRDHTAEINVSVNVSAHQFMSAGFVGTVASLLDSSLADPGLLTLEMTESFLVRDRDRALIVLGELKDLGVKLALDDFGTGYSSLSYLMRLPIDIIKIDRAFIANLAVDDSSHTIVTAIIQLAHGLGMTVVSEGVETAEQRHRLIDLGCDSCQGFYFGRPGPASSLEALLDRHAGHGTGLPVLPVGGGR